MQNQFCILKSEEFFNIYLQNLKLGKQLKSLHMFIKLMLKKQQDSLHFAWEDALAGQS